MKYFTKHIAFVFLFASSFFVVPKELVHQLTFHEDTVDLCCDLGEGLALSAEHHHCEALQLSTPPLHYFISDFTFSSEELSGIFAVEYQSSCHAVVSPFLFFRGPPVV